MKTQKLEGTNNLKKVDLLNGHRSLPYLKLKHFPEGLGGIAPLFSHCKCLLYVLRVSGAWGCLMGH